MAKSDDADGEIAEKEPTSTVAVTEVKAMTITQTNAFVEGSHERSMNKVVALLDMNSSMESAGTASSRGNVFALNSCGGL